ncbi:hypothetical protein [Actinoplanes palleronii]|uniref:Uncharacterized protein n=1 Tax=Actinoplanes palleronii TaxID=113570 RepID=A0ABQ4B7C9_9ACTN|nr:hypothetical protein [Actinoplanes palleronii]GIE66548.1 hypothetical protein Apa02nite_026560 [Actinoplanes palleronii]
MAERLLLVDAVDRHFRLDQPTFIGGGQTYWIDRETEYLCVDRGLVGISRHPGRMYR